MAKGLPKSIIKKYGVSKKAWQVYKEQKKGGRKTKSKSKKSKSKKSGGRKKVAKKKTYRRRSFGFGKISLKGAIFGGLLIAAAKWLVRRFAPQFAGYESNVALIGAGLVKKSFLPVGVAMTVGDLIVDYLTPGGMINAPWVGAKTIGGYDVG